MDCCAPTRAPRSALSPDRAVAPPTTLERNDPAGHSGGRHHPEGCLPGSLTSQSPWASEREHACIREDPTARVVPAIWLTAALAFEGGTLFAPRIVTRRQRVAQRDQATTARRARQHRVPQLRGLVCPQPNGGLSPHVEDVLHGACTWTHRFHCAPRPRVRRERRVTDDQRI